MGAAWDILGNGRWKLSSSWVRVNDVLKYELARGSFGGDYWHDHVYTLDSPDLSQLSLSNPGALGRKLIEIDNRTVPINAAGQLEGIDPDIKPMSHNNFDVTTEYLLAPLTTFTLRYTHKRLRYGIEDIGVLDEYESEVYTTGNPGYGLTSDSVRTPTGASVTPKAKRDYDGVEFRVAGRMTHFFYNASYTYSRLYGNWSGLASSDENGRSDPNVSRAFDLSPGNFDENGNNVYGLLGTDRPHTLKLFGNYAIESKLGTTMLGLSQQAFSGTPISSEVTFIVPDLSTTVAVTWTDGYVHPDGPARVARVRVRRGQADGVGSVRLQRVQPGSGHQHHTPLQPEWQHPAGAHSGSLRGNTRRRDPVRAGLSPTASPSLNPIYNRPLGYQEARQIRVGVGSSSKDQQRAKFDLPRRPHGRRGVFCTGHGMLSPGLRRFS